MTIFLSKNSVCALFLLFLLFIHHVDLFVPYRREASIYGMILLCIHDFIRPPYMKPDMIYHHILSILLCLTTMFQQPQISYDLILPFFKTEISTVFLVIRAYGIRHGFNDLLFASTFAYYRVYGLTKHLWTSSIDMSLMHQFLGWNLVGLNTYWMAKILRHSLFHRPRPILAKSK